MSDVATNAARAASEIGGKKVAKKVVKKKVAKASKGTDGLISLADLAKEAKIAPASARVKLRAAEIERDGRWAFKDGSSALKAARKALGL